MWNSDQDEEFFVGYAPPMPPRLARFVKRAVLTLGCSIFAWAFVVAAGHVPLEGGTFEFGHAKRVSGTIVEKPYPVLQPDEVDRTVAPWLLLVAPGKHCADALVRGLNGQHVTFTGTRIQRGPHSMIEVEPASLVAQTSEPSAAEVSVAPLSGVQVDMTGEIVDSKCFLGVMVPGSGKTHKECASLCLRGGIPPALGVHDRSGHSSLLLLTGASGEPIGARALQLAGEAVSMTGSVYRRGGWLILRTDPSSWRPVDR